MALDAYDRHEHSSVKHFILKTYLQRLAIKLGLSGRPAPVTLNYVDGFSGPWRHGRENIATTSPYVALAELRAAREVVREGGGCLVPRALFVERDAKAHELLKSKVPPEFRDIEVRTIHGTFEGAVPQVLDFVKQGENAFGFAFIDPTGWTGYPMQAIAPLLLKKPGEVLVNLMTPWINRFIEEPALRSSFVDLFGAEDYESKWAGLSGFERENAIVETYCARLREVGQFRHVVSATVLAPRKDATKYHLVYGTRSLVGLVTFREVERRANAEQVSVSGLSRYNERFKKKKQLELLSPVDMGSTHLEQLLAHHRTLARKGIEELLRARQQVPYDDLVSTALQRPMVAESDLKSWLSAMKVAGSIEYRDLGQRDRIPKILKGHVVAWTA